MIQYLQNLVQSSSQKLFFLLFFATIIITFFVFGYPAIFDYGPASFHSWRQADSATIALCYYNDGIEFFKPRIHNGIDGRVATEFPIFYYVAACFYQLFGPQDVILRFLNYFTLITGIYLWGRILTNVYKNTLLSWLTISAVLGSPIVAYYGFNFIPNTPALGLVMIGGFFYFQYIQRQKNIYFYGMMFLFALAGAIKPTVLVPFLAIGGAWVGMFSFQRERWRTSNWFPSIFHAIIGFSIVLLFNIGWIIWSKGYNEGSYAAGFFLRKASPIFDMSSTEINDMWAAIWDKVLPQLITRPFFFLFAGGVLLNFSSFKRFPHALRWAYSLGFLGTVAIFFLFFKQYKVHDYYLIDFLPFILLSISMTIFVLVKAIDNHSKKMMGLIIGMTIFAGINYFAAEKLMTLRYDSNYPAIQNQPSSFLQQDKLRSFFEEIEVKYEDRKMAIIITDKSPNVALYKYNLRGWRITPNEMSEEEVSRLLSYPPSHYLIISDTVYLNKDYMQPYLTEPLGNFKDEIFVFKINEEIRKKAKDNF